jgi:hypothetical protein
MWTWIALAIIAFVFAAVMRRRDTREETRWAVASWVHPAGQAARWEQAPGRRLSLIERIRRGT